MIKKVFLIHHTHMDIGYTDLPLEVMEQHFNKFDDVLKLCRNQPEFRWTLESSYIVKEYLRHRGSRHREELLSFLRNGQIELTAFEQQPFTEMFSAAEFYESVKFAVELGQNNNFEVCCAILDDIGGFAGGMPTVFSQSGIRYLTAGPGSIHVHLPWAKLPHLFYLKAKNGSRVLIWNLGIDRNKTPWSAGLQPAVYGLGAIYLIIRAVKEYLGIYERGVDLTFKNEEGREQGISEVFSLLLNRLKQEDYPYEEIMLQFGGDNCGPASYLTDLIKKLNATGDFPEIVLATPKIFFKHMEDKYGLSIPELSGVITDSWSSLRTTPTPQALKTYRNAQLEFQSVRARLLSAGTELIRETEALQSVIKQNLMLYADHTCGLSEWEWRFYFNHGGMRGSVYDRYRKSWKDKAFYADAALDGAVRLDRIVKNRLAVTLDDNNNSIVVWNSSGRKASGIVEYYSGGDALPLLGITYAGSDAQVSFQMVGANRYLLGTKNNILNIDTSKTSCSNRYLLYVEDIPGFGSRVLTPYFDDKPGTCVCLQKTRPLEFENNCLKVKFDTEGNITSVIEKKSATECLDQSSSFSFGSLVLQKLNDVSENGGLCAGMMVSSDRTFAKLNVEKAETIEDGPVALTIRQYGNTAGAFLNVKFERDITFYHHHSNRIDIKLRLDKPEYEQKHSCHIAFPLSGTGGTFRYDQNIGWIDPARDLLPGAMEDAFYCSRFVNVDTGKFNVTICCHDAPVVSLGDMNFGRWIQQFPFKQDRNHVYGQIYHNLLDTDCPIWQEILDTFNYSVFFHDNAFDYGISQSCWDRATALSCENYHTNIDNAILKFSVNVFPDKIRILDADYDIHGNKYLKLENPEPENCECAITINNKKNLFTMSPHEVKDVILP